MTSAANVLYHPEIGRWLLTLSILFFLFSGPMLVFGRICEFVPVFCGGLALVVNAVVLLYPDVIGSWINQVRWTDLVTTSEVSTSCGSVITLLLSLLILNLTLQGRR